jgi:hypothetical protein
VRTRWSVVVVGVMVSSIHRGATHWPTLVTET